MRTFGDEVGRCCAKTFIHRSRSMAAPLGVLASREHVLIEGHSFRDERIEQELRYRRQVMRLGMKWAVIPVSLLSSIEPRLRVECFGLRKILVTSNGAAVTQSIPLTCT